MSAIERCRTAALGGHLLRCEKCAHTHVAYNSCRNRHCPKCHAAAANDWLAAREAELLPVPYCHVVFTVPAEIADIAYHNKAEVYDILFKVAAETLRPQAPRRPHRLHRCLAHLGLGAAPSPAPAHHRARRRHLVGRQALGILSAKLLPARARALQAVPSALPGKAPPGAYVSTAIWPTSPSAMPSTPISHRCSSANG
jgi:hypothetical protein